MQRSRPIAPSQVPDSLPTPTLPPKSRRPLLYTPEIGKYICERIAEGYTLRQIGSEPDMPAKRTVNSWRYAPEFDDREEIVEFRQAYKRAIEARTEHFAEELIEIADDSRNDWIDRETRSGRIIRVPDPEAILRSKLRVESRQWLMSKLLPQYRDKMDVTATLTLSALIEAARSLPGDNAKVIEHKPPQPPKDAAE